MANRINLTAEGRAFIRLNMKPLGSMRLEGVRFKLDTGADLTTISKKDLGALGYGAKWISKNAFEDYTHTLTSAGGKSMAAYYVLIPVSNLFGKDFRNWPFYILMEDDRDFPNLLGINVLSYFNFTFNYDAGYLGIEAAKKPVIKLPLIADQEVGGISLSELSE